MLRKKSKRPYKISQRESVGIAFTYPTGRCFNCYYCDTRHQVLVWCYTRSRQQSVSPSATTIDRYIYEHVCPSTLYSIRTSYTWKLRYVETKGTSSVLKTATPNILGQWARKQNHPVSPRTRRASKSRFKSEPEKKATDRMSISNRNTSRFARSFFLLMRVLSTGLPTVRELTALSTEGGIGSAVKGRVDQAPRCHGTFQSSRQLEHELSVAEKELGPHSMALSPPTQEKPSKDIQNRTISSPTRETPLKYL